jgi:MFS family permease
MVPQRELQPRAFSLMPLVWTIGSIFGPVIGGSLVNPATRFPEWFGNSEFFKRYPYALPNLVVSTFFIIGVSIGFLFLEVSMQPLSLVLQ